MALAQDDTEPAKIMILGTYHFANPGLDVAQFETADILTDSKQQEVRQVVKSLAKFKPTKIAVERRRTKQEQIDSLYLAYLNRNHELGRGEDEQLGFRIAAQFEHSTIYAIDHPGKFPMNNVLEYAKQHNPDFIEYFQQFIAKVETQMDSVQKVATVGEILRRENDPERIAWGHGFYMKTVGVGAGDSYVGADLLSAWYERNIRIFANLKTITKPGDRIIVIFGAGHAATLRDFIEADPDMKLVDTLDYITTD